MRQYFTHLRLYRVSDQNYWTMRIRWDAESLGDLDRQLSAFEAGAKLAGGGVLALENVGVDAPQGGGEFTRVGDPNLLIELQYFLGTRRDRRHKAPPKTEAEIEGGQADGDS